MAERRTLPDFVRRDTGWQIHGLIGRLEWSPDGTHLAVAAAARTRESSRQVLFLRVDEGGDLEPAGSSRPVESRIPQSLSWSWRDPTLLAVGSEVGIDLVRLGALVHHIAPVHQINHPVDTSQSIAFSPKGGELTALSAEGLIAFRSASGWRRPSRRRDVKGTFVSFSPDGEFLCVGGRGSVVIMSDGSAKRHLWELPGGLNDMCWSTDGRLLCTALGTGVIAICEPPAAVSRFTLEGHTGSVSSVAFSPDDRLLASKSMDGTIRFWRTDTWECAAVVDVQNSDLGRMLRFHPARPLLAYTTAAGVRLMHLDVDRLLATRPPTGRRYRNAKVVLVGETGAGKSGLGYVLSGQEYRPTDSTHGRNVWTFSSAEVPLDNGRTEIREVLLWDLAGQPGYRLIHQLNLDRATVALLVFDSRSDTDPFAVVRYWAKALAHSRTVTGQTGPQHRLLVAARIDRGGIAASPARIDAVVAELGLDGYFETSARDGTGIQNLLRAIEKAIDWSALPFASSNELFERIRKFLVAQKEAGYVLVTEADLYRTFRGQSPDLTDGDDLRASFATCVGLLASRDLIRRLTFGGYVLLQPELLDSYASALIDAARSEPDGLGYVREEDALAGRFRMSPSERVADPNEERLLLLATVKELLSLELGLRESVDGGVQLVFPTQLTRSTVDDDRVRTATVRYSFEGAVLNVYATLAVRLAHVTIFERDQMWQNVATYRTSLGGIVGMAIAETGEAAAELSLFFDEKVGEETQLIFEEYVRSHLNSRALAGTVERTRLYRCADPACTYEVPHELAGLRRAKGDREMRCPYCERRTVSLRDSRERLDERTDDQVREMNRAADRRRDQEVTATTMRGKREIGEYDVMFCYNAKDVEEVRDLAERLEAAGVLPWMDVRELAPGARWHDEIQDQLGRTPAAAVFLGAQGLGPWQDRELVDLLQRGCRVVPVLLPGWDRTKQPPAFLHQYQVVDVTGADPVRELIKGVTAKAAPRDEPGGG